jgi:hypothetical protein
MNPDNTPIDIHNPPAPDADPLVWMEYRHAVERAHFGEGKPAEYMNTRGSWQPRHAQGLMDWKESIYRIAPLAPVKRIAPFTAATFPKGEVWIKHTGWAHEKRMLVVGVSPNGALTTVGRVFEWHEEMENLQHSLDGGKTWLPWGLEVES